MTDTSTYDRCWICKSDQSLTGEHSINRADLADMFGSVTQANPLYLQTELVPNRLIRSLKSDHLKSQKTMCAVCNGSRTQPHDRAFFEFRRALTPIVMAGRQKIVRCNRLFPHDTGSKMLDVHLYFVKKFGEYIVETGLTIDLEPFARAILLGKPHPHVHLGFGLGTTFPDGVLHTGRSAMEIASVEGAPHDIRFAAWFAGFGGLTALVMFSMPDERRKALLTSWHPKQGAKLLKLANYSGAAATRSES